MTALREALRAKLKAAYTDNVQITGYVMKDPTPPFIDITPASDAVEYDLAAARGYDRWRFIVRVVVEETSDIGAQNTLDGFMNSSGDESIKEILEADQSLNGAAEAIAVISAKGYMPVRVIANPEAAYVGTEFTVELIARGSS